MFFTLHCKYLVILTTGLYVLHIFPVAHKQTNTKCHFTSCILYWTDPVSPEVLRLPQATYLLWMRPMWAPYASWQGRRQATASMLSGLWTRMESSKICRHGDTRQATAEIHGQIKKKNVTDTERDPAVSITLSLSKRRMQREKWDKMMGLWSTVRKSLKRCRNIMTDQKKMCLLPNRGKHKSVKDAQKVRKWKRRVVCRGGRGEGSVEKVYVSHEWCTGWHITLKEN